MSTADGEGTIANGTTATRITEVSASISLPSSSSSDPLPATSSSIAPTDNVASALTTKKPKSARQARATIKIPKGTRDIDPHQMRIREKAFSIVKAIFIKHGAVGIDTPVFELKETLTGKYGEDSKLIYDLADQGGEICALRYDLTVPFARYLALNGIDHIKRYHIARVYRRDNPAFVKGRFREFYQCDYDVAGTYAAMVPDAECIKVCTEVLDALPVGPYLIKLNHRKLIDAIMQVCGVPNDKFRAICSAIDKLDKEAWTTVKQEMIQQKGLEEKVADAIGEYVTQFKGDPFTVLSQLQADTLLAANPLAQVAFSDLSLLFNYLQAMLCLQKVSFDLSLARGLDYYTGIIYEAILVADASSSTAAASLGSIAAGGRYDGLVGMFSAKDVPAVGISIGIERIFGILEEAEQKAGQLRKNSTTVLVASIGKNLLQQRMSTCALLWQQGINAEFLYDLNPKPKKQLDVAIENGIPIVIWHGEDEEKEGVVKIKNMTNREEQKVKKEEMITAVKQIIATLPNQQ